MKHANGFYYLAPLLRCDTIRDLQWRLTRKAEQRDPRLLETVEVRPMVWDRRHRDLVAQVHAQIMERCKRLFPRLLRSYEWIAERNCEHLATLTPEQARAAFDLYHNTGLNGGSWGCLDWFEVLPPGITHQAAADALGEGFTVDRGWHNEGGRSVKRHSEFTPGAAKPRKGTMVAKRI
jgi:hypothetical protein